MHDLPIVGLEAKMTETGMAWELGWPNLGQADQRGRLIDEGFTDKIVDTD